MGFNENATKMLDIMPDEISVEPAVSTLVEKTVSTENAEIEDGYDFARNNIKEIIDTGMQAAGELSSVASQSESPRAYEVLGTLLKNAVDANKDLLDIKKTSQEIRAPRDNKDPTTVNNNLVLTTTELQKMLAQ